MKKMNLRPSEPGQLEMLYAFIASGIAAAVQHWLRGDMHESPQEIAQFIEHTMNGGLGYFLKEQ